jgi:hypothetical protein
MVPARAGVLGLECNKTKNKYVNCTISMLMKSGKSTVIDERIHPLAADPGCAGVQDEA